MCLTAYKAVVAVLLDDSQAFEDLSSGEFYLAKAPKVQIYYLRPAQFSNQYQS